MFPDSKHEKKSLYQVKTTGVPLEYRLELHQIY